MTSQVNSTPSDELDARRLPIAGTGKSSRYHYALLLGLKVKEVSELLKRVKQGLAFSSWEKFLRNTDLQKEDAVRLVQITPRTLSRRKEEGRLHAHESDRLLRAARMFALACDLFEGDSESARRWLTASQPGLGGATPIEYATTEVGAREVEALIGRLEHGIPS